MSKRNLTYKDFKKYFSNNLQNKDKHAFEKQIMQDAFEEEAFDGLSSLSQTDLENDLNELKNNVTNRNKRNKRFVPVWFRYAASILLLIGIGATIIVFLTNRAWNDSLLNDQLSLEMEIADSVLFDEELAITNQTIDTARKELFATNKQAKSKKRNEQIAIVEDKISFEDNGISEETDSDTVLYLEIIEFEQKVDIVAEEDFLAQAKPLVEEKTETTNVVPAPIVIRGVTSITSRKAKSDKSKNTDGNFQFKTIEGQVLSSDDGLSLPGVSIVLKDNPKIGTTTNMDGSFALNIPYENDDSLKTIIANFIGMESKEILLQGDSTILVYLEPSEMNLDEVIVTGYGVDNESEKETIKVNAKPPEGISINKYKKQILENINNSKLSAFPGKHRIRVQFIVDEAGFISDIELKKSPDKVFNEEITRVIDMFGDWIPATEDGVAIKCNISFVLVIMVE
ncbi:MAG: hypothetical protein A2W99_16410 [Bacteroidetes bacterium GWF2_33_16]|nr:MAG: hypothetical protein A2X00_14385 [Bacteroidetes bacterium GWE2_32_14]OFY03336.1 MAG: hypothetical protein A2W99_16410 [Bacteroidetes bacterium GWF2_33_16]